MRQVLFYIPLKDNWHIGPLEVPGFGFGIVLLVWCLAMGYSQWKAWREAGSFTPEMRSNALFAAGVAVGIVLLPSIAPVPALPVFGYGAMLVAAVLGSGWVAGRRAPLAGAEPVFARDMAVMLVLAGVVGARLFHLLQYGHVVYAHCKSLPDFLIATINLPDGGLVFYGGLIMASLTYIGLCWRAGIDPLKFGDAVVPAVFVGVAFGRLGCLMNGCCFGDRCDLPWGITFEANSVPWNAMVLRGFLDESAPATFPLHPTQIYSAFNGVVLAILTTAYYPFRRGRGSVLALAIMAYPLSRFCIEFVRNDEMGKFGTTLTISQWVSLGVFGVGAVLAWWSWTHAEPSVPSPAATARTATGSPQS